MRLLHVDSSILGGASVSRDLSARIVAEQRRAHPDLAVDYIDLAAEPLPHLDAAAIATAASAQGEDAVQAEPGALERFLRADIVVIGAPMYNFSVPSQLKSWIDRILVKGETFEYDEGGPRGLAGGKRVIAAVSRGGLYGAGSPAAPAEHVETYLRAVFGFIGAQVDIVVAEGVQMGSEARAAAIDGATREAVRLAA